MYKNIANVPNKHESQINLLYKDRVSTTIDLRNQLEQVTGDVKDNLSRYEVEKIGDNIIEQMKKAKERLEQQKAPLPDQTIFSRTFAVDLLTQVP